MDVLSGGVGSDTYYFGRGDSSDQITDQHSAKGKGPAPENYDVLQFGGSIGEDQLWFTQDSSNLIVSVIGTNDQVTINNWYRKDDFHIEEFRTSNGLYLLDSQVDNLVSAMANFAPPPPGQTTLSEDYRTQLEPVISSNWQS
jgi:Ca2+-binding RTX toxin-like protein